MTQAPTGTIPRRGWTTGARATAATTAAYQALLTGGFPDPVKHYATQGRNARRRVGDRGPGDRRAEAGITGAGPT